MNTGQNDFERRVRRALNELLPAMTADGGGADLVSCVDGVVSIRLVGSCLFCPSQSLSAEALRRGIHERVPDVAAVLVRPSGNSAAELSRPYVSVSRSTDLSSFGGSVTAE